MLRFDKSIYLSLLFEYISSWIYFIYFIFQSILRLSNSLWGSDALFFLEFVNVVFIFVLYFYWIHLVYTLSVASFARYREYIICLISFRKFSDVLPYFTCPRGVGNFRKACLEVNILRLKWSGIFYEKPVPSIFIGNILLSNAFRTLCLPSKSEYKFSKTFFFF